MKHSKGSPQKPKVEKNLTLMGHLDELRWRLVKCAIAVVITTGISFTFARQIFQIFTSRSPGVEFVYIEMTELLNIYIQVALTAGIAIALPFILYQVLMFVAPALNRREKTYLYGLLPAFMFFFAGGVVFAYFILMPPALKFLINPPFAAGIATPQIRIGNYVAVLTKLLFSIGLVFDMPLVIFILAKIGVLTYKTLAKHQRAAIIGAFLVSAFITPTMDPLNQSLVAGPLLILYELGIVLAWFARKRPARAQAPAPGLGVQSNP